MPAHKLYTGSDARVALSLQVPVERAKEIGAIAESLGITRHQLLLRAVAIGVPAVVSDTRRRLAAIDVPE